MENATDLLDIEAELAKFEAEERARLGMPTEPTEHWRDEVPSTFTRAQRDTTTLLVCGLTMAHDMFIKATLQGIGYQVEALDVPDIDALQYGREFGNRGQCNPTYFTVGNLVKHLDTLRKGGMSSEEIVEKFVFVTAGACGPCRFGTYVTEYRKALRDSGFDGFRVLLFQQTGGLKQATGEEVGLEMNPKFFWALVKAIMVGDVMNALIYRIRPYEVEPGATNAAFDRCKQIITETLRQKKNIVPALWRCRRVLAGVKVDRTRVRPKVAIIGEFWAMTTEGDGNYELQSFLESEGAEVEIQLVTAWLLYNIWAFRYDTQDRMRLRGEDDAKYGLKGIDTRKRLVTLAAADKLVRGLFQTFANILGLKHYHLPDMNEMAEVSHAFYDNNLRGGEGHMEVGKLILNIAHTKVNMTLSVKPFGCMPSSSVSDGVQSLITEMYPEGIFLPIETNGDGKVNVHSRVQMQLFKARQHAQKEVNKALQDTGQTLEEVQAWLQKHGRTNHSLHRSPHEVGCTAADLIYEVAKKRRPLRTARDRVLNILLRRGNAHQHGVSEIARRAAARGKKAAAPISKESAAPISKESAAPISEKKPLPVV